MSQSKMLSKLFAPKREEVTGEWRKLRNWEFHNLHSLPFIIRMTKSRRMRWIEHIALLEKERNSHKVSVGEHE
jgi:hypothetical protein